MSIREFVLKLQSLPESRKKIILWTVVIILGLVMGFFWINSAVKGFSKLAESTKSIKLPSVNMPNIPSMDILQTTTPSNIK